MSFYVCMIFIVCTSGQVNQPWGLTWENHILPYHMWNSSLSSRKCASSFLYKSSRPNEFQKVKTIPFFSKNKSIWLKIEQKCTFCWLVFGAMYLRAQTSCASGRIIYRECLLVVENPYFFSDNIQGPLCPHWTWFICVQSFEQYNSFTWFFFCKCFLACA